MAALQIVKKTRFVGHPDSSTKPQSLLATRGARPLRWRGLGLVGPAGRSQALFGKFTPESGLKAAYLSPAVAENFQIYRVSPG